MRNWYQRAKGEFDMRTAMDEYDVQDLFREAPRFVLEQYRNREPMECQKWRRVPIAQLERIWQQHAKGFIPESSEKFIDRIAEDFIWNVAQLYGNTVVSGHCDTNTYQAVEEELQEEGIEMLTEDDWTSYDGYDEFMYDEEHGNSCISDYAMDPLMNDCFELANAASPEEKLVAIDRMINRIHMRGNIAALFVEGGIESLDRLSETPEERNKRLVEEERERMWHENSRY